MASDNSYADLEQIYVNKGYVLRFFHIPTSRKVMFKALLTTFIDRFDSNWSEESVYGRMDTIDNFSNTKRTISLGWTVIAASKEEAKENLRKCSLLYSMLYPVYSQANEGVSTIRAAPLLKLSFANLIQNVGGDKSSTTTNTSTSGFGDGLVGRSNGFSFEPDLDMGMFDFNGKLYPKSLKLSCEYVVKHVHRVGWDENGNFLGNTKFPYGEDYPDDSKTVNIKKETKESSTDQTKQSALNRCTNNQSNKNQDYENTFGNGFWGSRKP